MPVVFTTDFSPLARDVGVPAARISVRLREPLELVHVMNPGLRDLTDDSPWAWHAFAEAQLDLERSRLAPHTLAIEEALLDGPQEKVLARHVEEIAARAVVIPTPPPATRRRSPRAWFSAPRYALGCGAPVLLIRNPPALRRWLDGDTPLRVMAGVDRGMASRAALRWLADLRRVGPCDLLVESIYWPPEEHERFGVHAPMGLDGRDPVEPLLLRELEQLVSPLRGGGPVRVRVHGNYGRPAEQLLADAVAEEVDLLVIGSPGHRPRLRGRASVAQQLLARAPMSIASVCAGRASHTDPEYRAILVAVPSVGDATAVLKRALSTVHPDGRVHLVQVESRTGWRRAPRAAICGEECERAREALIEAARPHSPRTVQLSAEVLEHREPAVAIAQAAERIGADLICVGDPLRKRRWGSLASRVASRTDRAVLAIGPEL